MSPRKPTVDDIDDIDDEDGAQEEEISEESDLDLTIHDDQDVALGGLPGEPEEEER